MLLDSDIYRYPESLADLKKELDMIYGQIKVVEGLEHARARLAARPCLDSNTLAKCEIFIRCINDDTNPRFGLEVSKLDLNELAFCSISFEERRLKTVVHHFEATSIKKYMKKTQVTCLDRPEVMRRLKRLSSACVGSLFHDLFNSTQRKGSTIECASRPDEYVGDGKAMSSFNLQRYGYH